MLRDARGGIKDASHIRKLAESSSTPMPIVDIAHSRKPAPLSAKLTPHFDSLPHRSDMLSARAAGGSSLDWSALVAGQRMASGCHPFKRARGLVRRPTDHLCMPSLNTLHCRPGFRRRREVDP